MPRLRYGFHTSLDNKPLSSHLSTTSSQAITTQIYLGSRDITPRDKNLTLDICQERDLTFYIHTPLTSNIAHHRTDIVTRSLTTVQKQLSILDGLPSAAVLHIGKCGPLSNVIKRTQYLNVPIGTGRVKASLLFENAAGQGTELGANWDELRQLFEGIDKVSNRIGLCLDTQHLFAAGMCDFENPASIERLFEDAQSVVKGGVNLIHLNDSIKPYRSRVDRHSPLGTGYIWNEPSTSSISGFYRLLELAVESELDLICETSNVESDYQVLSQWVTRSGPQLDIVS